MDTGRAAGAGGPPIRVSAVYKTFAPKDAGIGKGAGIEMEKIFLVEDDEHLSAELASLLTKYGYECRTSRDWANIVLEILQAQPHLVLLDINLPMYDGYYICRELRKRSDIPVIVVTSRNSDSDELMSMNLGADDYITKPYHTQILLARIAAVLARTYRREGQKIEHKGITLLIGEGKIQCGEKEAELTKNEMRILHLLMAKKGQTVSREEIMNALWQSDEFVDDNTLTVNINRLRKKLAQVGREGYLITKRGIGYLV